MHWALRVLMAGLGVAGALCSFLVYRNLSVHGRHSQTRLEFNTRRLSRDFRLLLGGEILLVVGGLAYAAGGAGGGHAATVAGEALAILAFLPAIYLICSWWRRLS